MTQDLLEELLDHAADLDSLEVKPVLQRIVDAAQASDAGPERIIGWWRSNATSGGKNYSRALVAAAAQHHFVADAPRRYADLEFEAMQTIPVGHVLWAVCDCSDCERLLRPIRQDIASRQLTELHGPAREYAMGILREVGQMPTIDVLEEFFAVGPSEAGADWLSEEPAVAHAVALRLLRGRRAIDAALQLIAKFGFDAQLEIAAVEAFSDPALNTHINELARVLCPLVGRDIVGFDTLSSDDLWLAAHQFSTLPAWPVWAPRADFIGVDQPTKLDDVLGLAQTLDARTTALLRAVATCDHEELRVFSERFYARSPDAADDAGQLALIVLFGSEAFFARAMVDLCKRKPSRHDILHNLCASSRGYDWLNHLQFHGDLEDSRRASVLLHEEASLLGTNVKELCAELDEHVHDVAIEKAGGSRAEVRGVLRRALFEERIWSGDQFRLRYVVRPEMTRAAEGLVFSIDGQLCCFAEGDLLDRNQAIVRVAEDAEVHIAHPSEMTAEQIQRWSEWLSKYKVVQPFAQLEESVHGLAAVDQLVASNHSPAFTQALQRLGWFWDEEELHIGDRRPSGQWFSLASGFHGADEPRPGFVSRVAWTLKRAQQGATDDE